jgi:hypothetical protein
LSKVLSINMFVVAFKIGESEGNDDNGYEVVKLTSFSIEFFFF